MGDRSDYGNNRGISPLSTAGKILAKILLQRLQTIAEVILPESQCGFRYSRSTIDMIFTLRQLLEKPVEQQQSLYMVFIDLSKYVDTVVRSSLWILQTRPETFLKIISWWYGAVYIDESSYVPFEISLRLRQWYVLAPTNVTLFLAALLSIVSEQQFSFALHLMENDSIWLD